MRVLVVDDMGVYRHAMSVALSLEALVAAVEAVADAETALQCLSESADSQLVLLNMAMADSAKLLRTIVEAAPEAKVVAIAVSDEDQIVACAEAGVVGYVHRADSFADLVTSMASVVRGETTCSPRVTAALLRRVATPSREAATGGESQVVPPARLTAREREIMQLVDEGLSNKQIARRLAIELPTVKNHIHHILQKLQVTRREDAAVQFRVALQRFGRTEVWS
jgi:DNA-binding NarL/FixJ family response regulator